MENFKDKDENHLLQNHLPKVSLAPYDHSPTVGGNNKNKINLTEHSKNKTIAYFGNEVGSGII